MNNSETVIVTGVVVVLMFLLVTALYALGGWLFALAWNLVVPIFWHTAPHLTWLHGAAIGWLIGLVGRLFSKE